MVLGVVVVHLWERDVGVVGGGWVVRVGLGKGAVLECHTGDGEGDVWLGGDVRYGVFEDKGRVGGGGEAVDEVGGAAGEGA